MVIKMERENLMVDVAYNFAKNWRKVIAKVDGEYYLIPALNRRSNDLTTFKKISKSVIAINEKIMREIPDYEYAIIGLEKRTGYDLKTRKSN